jgi:excinuclease ABC subunit B
MQRAIDETNRRRELQKNYNEANGITPRSVAKEISAGLRAIIPEKEKKKIDVKKIPVSERSELVKELSAQMALAAANLEFERAAELRDLISEVERG